MYHGELEKLVGKTISAVKLSEEDDMTIPILTFSDGTTVHCMSDDEGNDGGSLHIEFGNQITAIPNGKECTKCGGTCGESTWRIPLVKGKFCKKECARDYRLANPKQIPCVACEKLGDWTWRFKGMAKGTRCCSKACSESLRTQGKVLAG